MTGTTQQVLAVVLALGGALCYAVAAVTQQRCAAELTSGSPVDLRLVLRLARTRRWQLSMIAVVAGYALHAAALANGRLVIVEPVIPLGLLMALLLGARAEGRRLCWSEWTAALAAVAGLAVFLVAAQPSGGQQLAQAAPLGIAAAVAVTVAALCCLVTTRTVTSHRAIPLAIGGGIAAGVTDTLTKTVVPLAGTQQFALFGDVRLYLLALAGLLALTLQQNAYRAGGLAASLPAFVVLEPLVGSALGLMIYHERVGANAVRITIEVLAVLAAVWGIARLARSVIAEFGRLAELGSPAPDVAR
ncbi:MAG: DMT family transporter [Streptosporangiaceae bacterium]